MKVRFLPLQMKFDLINTLIIINLFLILLEYSYKKSEFIYVFILSFLILSILIYKEVLLCYLFNLDLWKLIFIFLIIFLYFIILDLIEDRNFDIYCLVTLVFLGSFILVTCDNLLTLYLGLELQTFSIFILIAKNRLSIKSSEAGLKYFILGALSSGFYLLGLTMMFLLGYSLNLSDINFISMEFLNTISLIFITLSFCFKLSLFPLHFWIPDIYEGSSWDIVALISTLPKISVIVVLIQFLINSNLIFSFSILSIIIGTLGSLNQTKIKRLLGYSGISHMGFIILGFSLLAKQGFIISNLYLFIYMLTMISLFILIINSNFSSNFIIELGGLKILNSIFSITLIFLILSIAGIPPLSGFISKWFLLLSCLNYNNLISSFIIILFSAIGAGYYLRLVKIIYFQKKDSYFVWKNILIKKHTHKELNLIILGFLLFFNIFIIFNFSFLVDFINISVINYL